MFVKIISYEEFEENTDKIVLTDLAALHAFIRFFIIYIFKT